MDLPHKTMLMPQMNSIEDNQIITMESIDLNQRLLPHRLKTLKIIERNQKMTGN